MSQPSQEELEGILAKVAQESWAKGKAGLFLSIGDNFGAAFEPALSAINSLTLKQAKLEVIGEDEKLLSIQNCPTLESANEVLAKNAKMVERNKLRFAQRQSAERIWS